MSTPGATELLIVLVIVLLILGPKRLPSLGRQLGGGIREFRKTFGGDTSARRGGDTVGAGRTPSESSEPATPASPASAPAHEVARGEPDPERRSV